MKEDVINYQEILAFLEQTRKWIGPNFYISVVGGEPLIYEGIFDIFKYCTENDIICMTHTNGISFSEKVCNKIIDSGLPYLSVSLDSHRPDVHNRFRGVKTAFDKCIQGLKYLSEHGKKMTLGVTAILMKDNIEEFDKSVDFFLSLPIHRFNFQPIRVWTEEMHYEKWPEYKYWIHDNEALNRVENYLLKKKKEDIRIMNSKEDITGLKKYFNNPISQVRTGRKKCTIGYNRLTIDYKGNVYLGCIYHPPVGNIKDSIDIKKIWRSAKAKEIRSKMATCQIPCTDICYKNLSLRQKIQKLIVYINSGLFQN